MKIIHLSAECYPVAKVGGLADVVGALPKYLNKQTEQASVVIPAYATPWIDKHEFEVVFEGSAPLGYENFDFRIKKEVSNSLGFPFYVIDIPGRFDRPGIYVDQESGEGYWDSFERFASFQIAVLDWLKTKKEKPDIIHCHDHHTGLVPFMLTQSHRYEEMKHIPTVLTVHNGEYHGVYDRGKSYLLPSFDEQNAGLLDWDGKLNCLAAGLKTCWQITTVSHSYMEELGRNSNGLEWLFQNEKQKSRGIINGIDTSVWDPETDPMIAHHYNQRKMADGKRENKQALCEQFSLDPQYPTISFIGRLVHEKGADLLPDVFRTFLESPQSINFIVLGTGDRNLHQQFEAMSNRFVGYFDASLSYNEPLAHQIYAGSDFMIMPSRVEPCGLNQMYSMRYGTIPIVRNVGGLKDTVTDLGKPDGYGFVFNDFTLEAANHAVQRAINLFQDGRKMAGIRKKIMRLDFSWNASAKEYIKMYKQLLDNR